MTTKTHYDGLVFPILVEDSIDDGVHALYIYEHDHGPSSSPHFGDLRLRIVRQQVLQGVRRAPAHLTAKIGRHQLELSRQDYFRPLFRSRA